MIFKLQKIQIPQMILNRQSNFLFWNRRIIMKCNLISFTYDENNCTILANSLKKNESKGKISPSKAKRLRDYQILMTLSDYQAYTHYPSPSSTLDYKNLLKSTCKDIRRVRDAVMVKSIPIYQKQCIEMKKCKQSKQNHCMLITRVQKEGRKTLDSLNFQAGEHKIKNSNVIKRQFTKKSEHRGTHFELEEVSGSMHCPQFQGCFQRHSLNKINRASPDKIVQKQLKQKHKNQFEFIGGNRIIAQSKTEAMVNEKITMYLYQIRANALIYGINNFEFQRHSNKRRANLRARIKKGNNSDLVKWLFKKRWWWLVEDEKESHKTAPNFIWSQLKDKTFFSQFPRESQSALEAASSHNHFPSNQYLGNKKALFYNMSTYYNKLKKNVFDFLPLTFHVMEIGDNSFKNFEKIYLQKRKLGEDNTWIIKPGENSNRGRGITVSNDFAEIKGLLSTYAEDKNQRSFILQKYIDQPLLYKQRKFDIRAYMLIAKINKTLRGFWYEDGYVRTSSFEFQLDDFNTFVHLTNDAIQTHSQSYGKYEEGNKLSYAHFQKYLELKFPQQNYSMFQQLLPQMKEIAIDSIRSSYRSIINGSSDKPIFEIFGLDFMIDEKFRPWLIEVNTNPCLETSCNILRKIIPKMLDDAFKLTLDVIFPPPENWPNSKRYALPSLRNKFELVFRQDSPQDSDFQQVQVPGNLSEDDEVYDEK